MSLWLLALIVFLLNLPCGAWRARVRKYSWPWFLAIHLPIPVVVWLRICGGTGFRLTSFPVIISAFFLGQWCGGLISLWSDRP